jgi:hypothetical protein
LRGYVISSHGCPDVPEDLSTRWVKNQFALKSVAAREYLHTAQKSPGYFKIAKALFSQLIDNLILHALGKCSARGDCYCDAKTNPFEHFRH